MCLSIFSATYSNQGGQILPLALLQAGFKTLSTPLEVVVEMQVFHFNSKGIPSPMSSGGRTVGGQ